MLQNASPVTLSPFLHVTPHVLSSVKLYSLVLLLSAPYSPVLSFLYPYDVPLEPTNVDGTLHDGTLNVHPPNTYPALGAGVGGVSALSYVHVAGILFPVNCVPLLNHVVFIVLALKSGSNAALPFAIFCAPKTVVVHPGLVVGIFSADAKFGNIKKENAKQIVPICFRLVIKLSVCVCVCVCVCVDFCGFARVDKFFVHFSSPLVGSFFIFCMFLCYQISIFQSIIFLYFL